MRPVLTVEEMRRADEAALRHVSHDVLVKRAGTAVANRALQMLGGSYARRVVVVAGPGSNGADGRVAASSLRSRGVSVRILDAAGRGERPPALPECDLVIDAAYGTGFHGSYVAPSVPEGALVLAVDIPSGVRGDTGEAEEEAVVADRTVSFAALKPGLCMGEGRARAGQVDVVDIGVPTEGARCSVTEDHDVTEALPTRPLETHKWASALAVVAGSPGMLGAATLCARSAMRAGAGMVRLFLPGLSDSDLPVGEAVSRSLPREGWMDALGSDLRRCRALAIGPGLGRSDEVRQEVRSLVRGAPCPVIVDGDGLWAIGDWQEAARVIGSRPAEAPVIITPHAGEYGALAGHPPGPDRLSAARDLAHRTGAITLCKGSTTVVSDPQGTATMCMTGSARLATAGTGDVLSGVIGAMLARGVQPAQAASLAAHVHGAAAGLGRAEGLLAGDLPELVSRWLSSLAEGNGD